MPKTNLTEEEKAKIIEALNEDTEPSPELMEKLGKIDINFGSCLEQRLISYNF